LLQTGSCQRPSSSPRPRTGAGSSGPAGRTRHLPVAPGSRDGENRVRAGVHPQPEDDSQIDELTGYGCGKIFTDTASGKLADRPELDKALAYLREGDVFVITRLSRAMRSLKTCSRSPTSCASAA
jgi:Resolvase, N terminal domain